jgi:hypothetical protein
MKSRINNREEATIFIKELNQFLNKYSVTAKLNSMPAYLIGCLMYRLRELSLDKSLALPINRMAATLAVAGEHTALCFFMGNGYLEKTEQDEKLISYYGEHCESLQKYQNGIESLSRRPLWCSKEKPLDLMEWCMSALEYKKPEDMQRDYDNLSESDSECNPLSFGLAYFMFTSRSLEIDLEKTEKMRQILLKAWKKALSKMLPLGDKKVSIVIDVTGSMGCTFSRKENIPLMTRSTMAAIELYQVLQIGSEKNIEVFFSGSYIYKADIKELMSSSPIELRSRIEETGGFSHRFKRDQSIKIFTPDLMRSDGIFIKRSLNALEAYYNERKETRDLLLVIADSEDGDGVRFFCDIKHKKKATPWSKAFMINVEGSKDSSIICEEFPDGIATGTNWFFLETLCLLLDISNGLTKGARVS